jgi:hypothetical protein
VTGPIHWRASEGNAPNWNVSEFPVVTLSEPLGPPSKIPTDGGPTAALGAVMEHQTRARPDGFTTDGRPSSAQTYRRKSLLWLSPSPSRW